MTSENLNIILTNAQCCISKQSVIVSKLLSIGDKCAKNKVEQLKLLIDYVDALRCYNTETTSSEFILKTYINSYFQISDSLKTYQIIIDGVSYIEQGDGVRTIGEIYENIISGISNILSYYTTPEKLIAPTFVYINITAKCDVNSITFNTLQPGPSALFINTVPGNCEIKNCLSEEDYNTIRSNIMNICDICECQLTK